MSVNIPSHFVTQYTTNVAMLLAIKGGKFRPFVTEGTYKGESGAVVDQYGAVEMQEVTSRFQPMGRVDAAVNRRWVYPVDYDLAQMVDEFDKLRLMLDPTSSLVKLGAEGVARKVDDIIADAFFGDAKTGKNGGTTETFDTTNHRVDAAIGAAADTGLNVDKIVEGVRLLENANVDTETEMPIMAITPTQHANLKRQMQVVSGDFYRKAGEPIMSKDGRVTEWGGVRFVVSKLVPSNASYRLCPMWVPSGMHLGVWKEPSARVDQRADIKGVPYQLYTSMTMGATRVEPGRVIQIECTE